MEKTDADRIMQRHTLKLIAVCLKNEDMPDVNSSRIFCGESWLITSCALSWNSKRPASSEKTFVDRAAEKNRKMIRYLANKLRCIF